jgi:hypothetical protein
MRPLKATVAAIGSNGTGSEWQARANVTDGDESYELVLTLTENEGPLARQQRRQPAMTTRTPQRQEAVAMHEPQTGSPKSSNGNCSSPSPPPRSAPDARSPHANTPSSRRSPTADRRPPAWSRCRDCSGRCRRRFVRPGGLGGDGASPGQPRKHSGDHHRGETSDSGELSKQVEQRGGGSGLADDDDVLNDGDDWVLRQHNPPGHGADMSRSAGFTPIDYPTARGPVSPEPRNAQTLRA